MSGASAPSFLRPALYFLALVALFAFPVAAAADDPPAGLSFPQSNVSESTAITPAQITDEDRPFCAVGLTERRLPPQGSLTALSTVACENGSAAGYPCS